MTHPLSCWPHGLPRLPRSCVLGSDKTLPLFDCPAATGNLLWRGPLAMNSTCSPVASVEYRDAGRFTSPIKSARPLPSLSSLIFSPSATSGWHHAYGFAED